MLDVAMPGLNGIELQQALATRGGMLPIVFLTGHGDIPMSVQAIKRGAADFLTKPVDDEVLLAAIRNAFRKNRASRKALGRLFRSAGFLVESLPSGDAFLRSVDDHEPDCVVLDLHMPDLNGFDVQARLAQSHSGVPVVVITGHDTPESRTRALGGGAKSYRCKPVDDETLLKALGTALASSN